MNIRYFLLVMCAFIVALTMTATSAQAARVHKNMLNSKLAAVTLTTRDDLKFIDDAGGIVDNVDGTYAEVYLLPEDFDALRARGFDVRWIRDFKTEFLQDLWARTRHSDNPLDDYHTNNEIQTQFAAWQTAYPTLFHYESIGTSVNGRSLWVAKLSDNVTSDEAEIEVKYISTMHGNEPPGTENCMNMMQSLLTQYGTDPELTQLMNDYELWFFPMMNPDGNASGVRTNAHGADLNRDFPDRNNDSVNTTTGREPETAAVMNWSAAHNFVLSANFHTGAVVANYPWDGNPTGSYVNTPTPEDSLFRYLSLQYSSFNSRMYNSTTFPQGITNGADWYAIFGGMQDWNYVWMGDKEITIEIDDSQPPDTTELPTLWTQNSTSMRKYLLAAEDGIRGIVTDSITGLPLRASIKLGTIPYLTYSSTLHGEYFRILRPGSYTLTFSAPDHASRTITGINVVAGTPTVLNVALGLPPDISTSPATISGTVGPCSQADVPVSIVNTGGGTLDWSAVEAYVNGTGYGSATGGGWRFIDSDHSGGPVFSWVDISTRGTAVAFTGSADDDAIKGPFTFVFNFPYYGQNYTSYRISANGWISFTSTATGQTSYNNVSLPNAAAPLNIIAPWWDDLSPQNSGQVRRFSNADSLIVSYGNVPSYSGGGLYNFQVMLLASGKIIYQYNSMGTARLNSSTIGLQNSAGDMGTRVIYNQTYIHNQMAISFCPNSMIVLIPSSGSVPSGSSQAVTARLQSCCVPLGQTAGTLSILSNDPDMPTLNVTVSINVSTAPPSAVDDLTISPDSPDMRLNWGRATLATSYRVYFSPTYPVTVSSGDSLATVADTFYVHTNAAAGTTGYYVVTSLR